MSHRDAVLSLDDGGGLRLAVVADTHNRPHAAAAERIRALAPAAILHAGDIGERHVLDDLATIAPVIAVRGNIDDRAADLPDSVAIDVRADGESVGSGSLPEHAHPRQRLWAVERGPRVGRGPGGLCPTGRGGACRPS